MAIVRHNDSVGMFLLLGTIVEMSPPRLHLGHYGCDGTPVAVVMRAYKMMAYGVFMCLYYRPVGILRAALPYVSVRYSILG